MGRVVCFNPSSTSWEVTGPSVWPRTPGRVGVLFAWPRTPPSGRVMSVARQRGRACVREGPCPGQLGVCLPLSTHSDESAWGLPRRAKRAGCAPDREVARVPTYWGPSKGGTWPTRVTQDRGQTSRGRPWAPASKRGSRAGQWSPCPQLRATRVRPSVPPSHANE